MKKISLKFLDDNVQKEYIKLRHTFNSNNHRITLYFLLVFIAGTGIPEAIDRNLGGSLTSLITAIILISISLLAHFFQKFNIYASLLTLFVIFVFTFSRFFLFATPFDLMTRGLMYFRGYSFASLQIVLISRFSEFKQKAMGIILGYIIKFLVVLHFDNSIVKADLIIRHIVIDGFIIYNFYVNEKQERQIFLDFWKYRESLIKFKKLLTDHLPQSLTILNNDITKPLFSNRTFLEVFSGFTGDKMLTADPSPIHHQRLSEIGPSKIPLESLEIEKSFIRESNGEQGCNNVPEAGNLRDIVERISKDESPVEKTWVLTASSTRANIRKLFEIILKKIKWDQQNAVAAIFNDITYQEHLIALKIADSNKDKILATVSHELRTPLNVILNILQICEKKVTDQQMLSNLLLCKDNAILLLGLVNSLLDLQQMSKGQLRLSPGRTNIHKVLEDMIRLFSFQAKQSDISLSLEIHKEVPLYVNTDENRLKQILINLMGNALKFTFKRGSIRLEAAPDPSQSNYLQISVSDTGVGISEEEQGKLFRMYGRLEDKEGVNKNGVGLGLTVVNALAKALSANRTQQPISLESKVGVGSRFTFWISTSLKNFLGEDINDEGHITKPRVGAKIEGLGVIRRNTESDGIEEFEELLPVQNVGQRLSSYIMSKKRIENIKAPEASTDVMAETEKKLEMKRSDGLSILKRTLSLSPLRKKKSKTDKIDLFAKVDSGKYIMAVDDNPFNLLVAENVIKETGYKAVTARGGLEAIDLVKSMAKEQKILKVILMDCQMPVIDGFETTKILNSMMGNKEIEKVPIFALTANTDPRDIERCFESGMSEYLPKPLMRDSLLKALEKVE